MEVTTNSQYTVIQAFAGGGNWLTQSYPTNFHAFYKTKILTADEKVTDFCEVTDDEKAALEAADAKWERPPQSFIDLWIEACGSYGCYNDSTGFFELNGLTDITYKEAIAIMQAGIPETENINWFYRQKRKIRTNLPYSSKASWRQPNYLFDGCINLEAAFGSLINISIGTFYGCSKLKKIIGMWQCASNMNNAFGGCQALENIEVLYTTNYNINFADCPKLDKSTFSMIIGNKTVATTTTITVHPAVMAKLTGDTTNAAAAALTEAELDEWMALVDAAANKNIQFATT